MLNETELIELELATDEALGRVEPDGIGKRAGAERSPFDLVGKKARNLGPLQP